MPLNPYSHLSEETPLKKTMNRRLFHIQASTFSSLSDKIFILSEHKHLQAYSSMHYCAKVLVYSGLHRDREDERLIFFLRTCLEITTNIFKHIFYLKNSVYF